MKSSGKLIASIRIRETPERRLISPRTEESRAHFYTDEEYDRFQREASSLAWLLEGAADADGQNDAHHAAADIFTADSTRPYLVDLRVADAERLPLAAFNRDYSDPPNKLATVSDKPAAVAAAPCCDALPAVRTLTRLEREIETLNMRELKEKIKVSLRCALHRCGRGISMRLWAHHRSRHNISQRLLPSLVTRIWRLTSCPQEITRRRRERAHGNRPADANFYR
jgi:hypothetical protein